MPDDDINCIYRGLQVISGKGRRYLKDIAQTLVLAQEQRGFTLPDQYAWMENCSRAGSTSERETNNFHTPN